VRATSGQRAESSHGASGESGTVLPPFLFPDLELAIQRAGSDKWQDRVASKCHDLMLVSLVCDGVKDIPTHAETTAYHKKRSVAF